MVAHATLLHGVAQATTVAQAMVWCIKCQFMKDNCRPFMLMIQIICIIVWIYGYLLRYAYDIYIIKKISGPEIMNVYDLLIKNNWMCHMIMSFQITELYMYANHAFLTLC